MLICNTKYNHITPVLASLHWLPVSFRIDFKLLHGPAPDYILDLLVPYVPKCNLRSLDRGLSSIPESRLKSNGDKALAVRAPMPWNELPEEIRLPESVFSSKSQLKTYFYQRAFQRCLSCFY